MTFRRKLLGIFALTVVLSVGAVAWLVLALTRNAFAKTEDQRTAALIAQFQREFKRRGDDVARRVDAIASSDPVSRMATALSGSSSIGSADSAEYFELAKSMAESHQLDFLEFLDGHGAIISSAQWPAKFGYPETAFESLSASSGQGAFLKREELQDSAALGLFAVQTTGVSGHPLYVIGGRRLDKDFLSALDLPAEMRVLLYQNRSEHFSPDSLLDPSSSGNGADAARPADRLALLIESVQRHNEEMSGTVSWSSDPADEEMFHAIPLRGAAGKDRPGKDQPLLAILLVGNSRRS
jgi:two-component system, NtrC family, nitrogen regulation sensor histidine kinase NtrY